MWVMGPIYYCRFSKILCFFLISFSLQLASAQEKIKIGAILHLTGDQAMQGNAFRQGIEVAVDRLNKEGGLSGKPLEVIFEDSQLKPRIALDAATKLLAIDQVKAAINASYLESMANGRAFEFAHVPVITLWDTSPQIEELGDYVFGIGIWTPSAGEQAARFASKKLKAKSALIVSMQNEWSQAVSQYFKKHFEELGGTVLEIISLPPSTSDFREVFLRIREKKPAVIYAAVTDNVVAFYKQLRQQQIDSAVISSDIINEAHIKAEPSVFEGVYQTQAQDPSSAMTKTFAQLYREKFGEDPLQPLLSSWGFDAVMLIAKAIERGGVDSGKIKDNLYKIRVFHGASGLISFNEKGSSPTMERVFQIKDAKFRLVE